MKVIYHLKMKGAEFSNDTHLKFIPIKVNGLRKKRRPLLFSWNSIDTSLKLYIEISQEISDTSAVCSEKIMFSWNATKYSHKLYAPKETRKGRQK